jgi:hypothetical protein
MSCDKTARIIIKQGVGVPTIPVSTDHRNGDWIATDIYEGEQYLDTDTGLVYTRWANTIVLVGSAREILTKHLLLTQTGTNAPVDTQFNDPMGGGVWAYVGVGIYTLTLAGAFIAGKTSIVINTGGKNGFARAWRVDNDTIRVETFTIGLVASNDVLEDTALIIQTQP